MLFWIKQEKPQTFEQNKKVAKRGGAVASDAKKRFEQETGQKAVSSLNATNKQMLEVKKDNV